MDVLYTAVATARGGREGEVVSDDGVLDLMLAMPKELGGAGGEGPHQPRAAVCGRLLRMLALGPERVAKGDGLDVETSWITTRVGLGIDALTVT